MVTTEAALVTQAAALSAPNRVQAIRGVHLRALDPCSDRRGSLVEIFRESWGTDRRPVQWNAVLSGAGVVRGVHVHLRHDDYVVLVQGRASLGLHDLRPDSPTVGVAGLIHLAGDAPVALTVPAGVAHGFYFWEPSTLLVGVSDYYDPADELGCFWADPALGIPWPVRAACLSDRDAALPSFHELQALVVRGSRT
jgi:dTDP-4-dehydrorhamnose 3,5-epimerase